MKKITVLGIISLLFILALINVDAVEEVNDTIYLNADFYKYNGEEFNKQVVEITGTKKEDNGILFTGYGKNWTVDGQTVEKGRINTWVSGDPLFPGMAKSELENGNIQFNYVEAGLFDESTKTKEIYKNVGIPLVKGQDGWYSVSSDKSDIYFPNAKAESNVNLLSEERQKRVDYIVDGQRIQKNGFFPLNNYRETAPYEEGVYHFGIHYDFPILLPERTNNGKDIIHKFSGDDDIWIYLDGKLVLDMGGLKDPVLGTINFTTGDATIYSGNSENSKILYQENLKNILGKDWDKKESYVLSLFYLERGKGGSNIKIQFNIPDKSFKNKIVVKHKDLETNKEIAKEEEITGAYGNLYQTKPNSELLKLYNVIKVEGNENGRFDVKQQEITYYYVKGKIDKKSDKKSYSVGENINYTIKSYVPYSDLNSSYEIEDILDKNLEFIGTYNIVGLKADSTKESIIDKCKITTQVNDSNQSVVKFKFNYQDIKDYVNIIIDYKAKLNENIMINKPIKNTATLNFIETLPDGNNKIITKSVENSIKTYGLLIYKTSAGDSNTGLAHARFKVYRDANKDDITKEKVNGIDNNVVFLKEIETDESGYAYLAGVGEGNFYLVETKAPTGHLLLKTPVQVTITEDKLIKDGKNSGYYLVEVKNEKGFTLPLTSGKNIYGFVIIGSILIVLSLVILFYNRKRLRRHK